MSVMSTYMFYTIIELCYIYDGKIKYKLIFQSTSGTFFNCSSFFIPACVFVNRQFFFLDLIQWQIATYGNEHLLLTEPQSSTIHVVKNDDIASVHNRRILL